MKATELREMTAVELNKQLKDLKAELFNHAVTAYQAFCQGCCSFQVSRCTG